MIFVIYKTLLFGKGGKIKTLRILIVSITISYIEALCIGLDIINGLMTRSKNFFCGEKLRNFL